MSAADGSVELVFAGDLRKFRLSIENLIVLQERCGAGPLAIANRLRDGTWRIEDVIETLRLGLIGGGEKTSEWAKTARKLVEDNVRPGRITEHVLAATAVLLMALHSPADDPVGKDEAGTEKAQTGSPPQNSTEQAPQ